MKLICLFLTLYLASAVRVEVKDPDEIAFYAQILYRHEFKCAAVVISNNFLLTTAKCTRDPNVEEYEVLFSTKKNFGDYRHSVSQIIPCPYYYERKVQHNIALIKLNSATRNGVKPVQLATRLPSDESTTSVKIMGFFSLENPFLISDDAKVESFSECRRRLRLNRRKLRLEEYCIKTEDDYPCSEEGAPALIDGKLFAIATYNQGINVCTSNSVPMSYLNVFNYREWIIKTAALDRSYFPSVNRKAVKIGEASFYAQLLINGELVCAATVLSSNFLLTTANCALQPKEDYQVLVGTIQRGKSGKNYSVAEIILHDRFRQHKYVNNVALIKVSSPMGDEAKPIPLSIGGPTVKNLTPVKIYGFAAEGDVTQNSTDILLSDDKVCITDHLSCCEILTKDNRYCDNEISCVNTYDRYPCMEYGSPLLYKNKLFAIYSTFEGLNWCQPSLHETPLSYVQVEPYLDWLVKHSDFDSLHYAVHSNAD